MRRALFGTLAGWLAGAASVIAQVPAPAGYTPYSASSAHFDAPGADDGRRATTPSYGPVSPSYGSVAPTYGPAAPPGYMPAYVAGGPVMTVQGNGPTMGPAMQAMPEGGQMMAPDRRVMAPNGMMGGRMMAGPGCGNGNCGAWGNGESGEACWDNGCGNGGANGCCRCPNGVCGPEGRMWVSAELLLWWAKGQRLPPLVTMGNSLANPGIIGQQGTTVLFGNGRIDEDPRLGGRLRLGFWLDECQTIGVEGSFAFLGNEGENFRSNCHVGDVLGRPFFNVDPAVNAQDAEIVCAPGVLCGDVNVRTQTEFYAADINLRRNLCCNCASRLDLVGGVRYLHLGDDVAIRENLTNLDPTRGAIGEGFIVQDRFHTNNNFYGGQIGLAGEFRSGQIFADWRALVALGSTQRVVTIAGTTTFLDPVVGGNPVTQPGGLLALPSNIGTHSSSAFSVAPEFNVNLGYQVAQSVRVWVGYSFLYWNKVARAGEQIDLNVDATQLPTRNGPGVGTAPLFTLHTNDFWAQGISFGLQLRY